jgi:hypothetical protein
VRRHTRHTVPRLHLILQIAPGTLRQALHELGYVWIRSRYELEPDPELEKKSPNTPANPGLAAPQCAAG